jgi:tRNA1Val (adenine37-N6)-methyltransferase
MLYDLVICNPPYYPEHLTSPAEDRRTARQGSHGFSIWTLPFIAAKLVHPEGKLSVVLPASACYHFIELSNDIGLFVNRRLNVRHSKHREVSVVLLEMGRKQVIQSIDELILFDEQKATQDYMMICGEFIRVGH